MNKHLKYILAVSKKEFRSLKRQKYTLFFAIIFPIMFMGIYSLSFKSTENMTFNVAVVNFDNGYTFKWTNGTINETYNANFGELLIEIMNNTKTEDNTSLFNIIEFNNVDTARQKLANKDFTAIIIIPENFSWINANTVNKTIRDYLIQMAFENNIPVDSIKPYLPTYIPDLNTTVVIEGDMTSSEYFAASEIINGMLREFENQVQIMAIESVKKGLDPARIIDYEPFQSFVEIKRTMATDVKDINYFDISVPGLIIFGIMSLTTTVSGVMLSDVETHRIWRLKLSKLSSIDLIIGNFIAYTVFAEIVALMFILVALVLEFHWAGGLITLGTAMIFVTISAMATIAFGLIIGGVSKNTDMSTLVSLLTYLPITFLIGVFFPINGIPRIMIFGKEAPITFILPWASCLSAMKQSLIYGYTLDSLIPELTISIIGTIILLIPAVIFYRKIQMRAE